MRAGLTAGFSMRNTGGGNGNYPIFGANDANTLWRAAITFANMQLIPSAPRTRIHGSEANKNKAGFWYNPALFIILSTV